MSYMSKAVRALKAKRYARVEWLHREHNIRFMLRARYVYEDIFQPWPKRPMPHEIEVK